MVRTPKPYFYTYASIADLAGVPENLLHVEVKRGDLDMNDLANVLVWLAGHAKPVVRAKLARQLVPVVLGLVPRRLDHERSIGGDLSPESDLLVRMFEADKRAEDARRKRISKTKRRRRKEEPRGDALPSS
jgi:hypothetical protein